MGDEEDRAGILAQFVDALVALALELGIPGRQGLVDEQHVPLTGEIVEERGVHAEQGRVAIAVHGALLGGEQPGDRAQQRGLA